MNLLTSIYYRSARPFLSDHQSSSLLSCSCETQAKLLAKHLEYCRENIPMYRHIIPIGPDPFENLSQIPIFDKKKYSANSPEACAGNIQGTRIDTTSGTSGQSFAFRVTKTEIGIRKVYEELASQLLGLEPSQQYLQIWGGHESESRPQRIKNQIYDLITGRRLIIVKGADKQSLEQSKAAIQRHVGGVLITYPSILHGLCRHADSSRTLQTYRSIILTGEAVNYAEFEPFNLTENLKNRYGSREFGVIGIADQGSMRYFASKYVLETSQEHGLLVTDLSKKAMPMLRYPIGDFVDAQLRMANRNPAIETMAHLGRLSGRVMDVLRGRSGTCYVGTFWTLTMRKKAGISQFRLVQNGQQLEVHYVGDQTPDDVKHVLDAALNSDFDLVIIKRDTIPELKNAKQKIVENHTPTPPKA
jgi:phenylacetate-coenzyme A ligase PaaK-like adenylate-forming protein